MTEPTPPQDELAIEASEHFRRMVESVGVKRFAGCMDLSTRQINRMLSGAQPNPVDRLVRCLQSCQADVGDEALGFICQEAGGLFIKDEEPDLDHTTVNAVRECAEAIVAIADGRMSRVAEKEIREAICALTALLRAVREERVNPGAHENLVETDERGEVRVVQSNLKGGVKDGVAQSA